MSARGHAARTRTVLRTLAKAVLGVDERPSLVERIVRPARRDDMVRVGGACGWWIPREWPDRRGVAYCVGAGEDISFDLELHARGYRVVTVDPTPRAIAHVARVAPHDDRFQFLPVGCWDEETELRFYSPRDPLHVSHSALNLERTDTYFTATVKPLWQLRRELGDEHVDLIKLDIEGAEYRVLRSLLARGPRPDVLCVEFDARQPMSKTVWYVTRLRVAGYSVAHVDRWNYTFVRRAGRGLVGLRG